MYSVVVMCCALVAVASAGVVAPVALAAPVAPVAAPAPLLPRVQVAPAQVTVVRQPHVVQQPELRLRAVPVPVRAVSYTAPAVAHVAAPALIAPSQVTYSAHGVPAIVNFH